VSRFCLLFASVVLLSAHPLPDEPETGDPANNPPPVGTLVPAPDLAPEQPAGDTRNAPVGKRVFGVLPNYRTVNSADNFMPLTTKQKFYIGLKDSTDYPVIPLAGAFAGLAQLTDQHAFFGQGMAGYGRRFGTAFGDQVIGNMMTESIMPTLFHQDPRYFRRGYGSKWSRAGYAATRIFVAPDDKGRQRFNFSEVIGNSVAAGIGNAYYPGERTGFDNVQRLYTALATDSFSQVLKEFWPDIKRWYVRRHKNGN
jgi:hypothetical protein